MSCHSGVSLIIVVELPLIVDFPDVVPATIGAPAMLRGYRGSPINQSLTLAGLLVIGEA
jgi:hypothetical protein